MNEHGLRLWVFEQIGRDNLKPGHVIEIAPHPAPRVWVMWDGEKLTFPDGEPEEIDYTPWMARIVGIAEVGTDEPS